MKIKYYILALLLCFSGLLFAQDPKFSASVSKNTVAVGEVFEVTFTFTGNPSRFTPPGFEGFQIAGGPNQSSMMSSSNGVTNYSYTYSYELVAGKVGSYAIGTASATIDGKVMTTPAMHVTVVKGSARQQNNNNQPGGGMFDEEEQPEPAAKPADISKSVFIKADVDKTHVFIGEPLIVTYRLYSRMAIVGSNEEKVPDLNGFWSQDTKPRQQQPQWRNEIYKGQQFQVIDLKQTILFPERNGELTLDPYTLSLVIRQQAPAHSLMEQFFGSYKEVKYKVKSEPVTIHVKPAPDEGKPAGFSGAVGNFSVSAEVDKKELKANEALNYKLTITGSGNIKLLEAPAITPPSDFEKYDPKLVDSVTVGLNGVKGQRIYTYLLIPRHEGNYTLEPVRFSYFNPATKSYVTVSTKAFNIKVNKGVGGANVTSYSAVDKQDIRMLSKDIRYIKTNGLDLYKAGEELHGSFLYYFLLFLGPLIFAGGLAYRRWDAQNNSDLVKVKSRKANKIAAKHLQNAAQQLQVGDKKAFYEAVFRGLYGYLSDKLNIPAADLNKEKISAALKARSVDDQVIAQLIDTLDLCEMARFAPVSNVSEQTVFDKAKNIINDIEDKI